MSDQPPMSDDVAEAVEAIQAADDDLALQIEAGLLVDTPKGPPDDGADK